MSDGYEAILLGLFWMRGSGPDRFVMHERVTVDTGFTEEPTTAEMQRIMHTAKMEWGRCLRARRRAPRSDDGKEGSTR